MTIGKTVNEPAVGKLANNPVVGENAYDRVNSLRKEKSQVTDSEISLEQLQKPHYKEDMVGANMGIVIRNPCFEFQIC